MRNKIDREYWKSDNWKEFKRKAIQMKKAMCYGDKIPSAEFDTHIEFKCGCVETKLKEFPYWEHSYLKNKLCLRHSPVETLLWRDLQTDEQRIEFLKKGLAVSTRLIAKELEQDLIRVYEFRKNHTDMENSEVASHA